LVSWGWLLLHLSYIFVVVEIRKINKMIKKKVLHWDKRSMSIYKSKKKLKAKMKTKKKKVIKTAIKRKISNLKKR